MKQMCHGCRAFSLYTYGAHCWLDFPHQFEAGEYRPQAECPKPRTIAQYGVALAENRHKDGE